MALLHRLEADRLSSFIVLQGNENGMTLISNNPFINKKELGPFEKGIRIDYILFKVGGRAPRRLHFNPFILIPSGFQSRRLWFPDSDFSSLLFPRVRPKPTCTATSCPPPKAPSPTSPSRTLITKHWRRSCGSRCSLPPRARVAGSRAVGSLTQVDSEDL